MEKLKFSKSKQVSQVVTQYLPFGNHYSFYKTGLHPITTFTHGRGSRLWDVDGNEHLDLFCRFGAMILGHDHPRYNAGLKAQIDKILAVEQAGLEECVCERLLQHIPSADNILFGLSGTEIVQNALRLARAYTGRNQILRFVGHYHGSADNIMGGSPHSRLDPRPVESAPDVYFTEGRAQDVLQNQSYIVPWNDVEALDTVLDLHGADIAAIIMEPVCLNGGAILPQPGYLEHVRALCNRYGVVLIFDEIITGFRIGLSGAQGLIGVTPDVTLLGKALSGGAVPVSAMAGRKELMSLYAQQRVVFGGTYNGYPLGLAAILATLDILENDSEGYDRMGRHLIQMGRILTDTAAEVDLPMVVQGMPTALAFHVSTEPLQNAEDYVPEMQMQDSLIKWVCEGYGIQMAPRSRLYSNLMLDEADVHFFAERIGDALCEAKKLLQISVPRETSAAHT